MSKFKPGDVVIVSTGQAGTIWFIDGKDVGVWLANGDIWYGFPTEIRLPKNREELDACPRDVPKKWSTFKRED